MVLNFVSRAHGNRGARPREAVALLCSALLLGACSSSQSSSSASVGDVPHIVVTHEVLGSIVREVVGDSVDVNVIIPNGKDPHDYEPSARDIATLNAADLIVANGENFEPAFREVVKGLVADGKKVFFATEHVTLRQGGDTHAGDDDGHAANDPHFFTDPATVGQLVPALARAISEATGVSLAGRVAEAISAFTMVDLSVREKFNELSPGNCKIATGHESLGYLAARYGCDVIGVVIPSLSGQAEATAQDFAELAASMRREGVTALFVDEGTSTKVSDRIAAETGARVVALPSHSVPTTGRYGDYVMSIATLIVNGLATA